MSLIGPVCCTAVLACFFPRCVHLLPGQELQHHKGDSAEWKADWYLQNKMEFMLWHEDEAGAWWSLRSLPTQAILWFYDELSFSWCLSPKCVAHVVYHQLSDWEFGILAYGKELGDFTMPVQLYHLLKLFTLFLILLFFRSTYFHLCIAFWGEGELLVWRSNFGVIQSN